MKCLDLALPKDKDDLPKLEQSSAAIISPTAENTIDLNSNEDTAHPSNWSGRYKWTVISLVGTMTMIDVFATTIFLPAVPQILREFDSNDQLYSVILVSIWELGEGLGPFIIAPLSEIYGRLPVFHIANLLFTIFTIGGALSTNLSMLVTFRFLNGVTVASLILGPGMVGDMFTQNTRGRPMAALNLPGLLGPLAGPFIGGYIAQVKGWRWTFWIITISISIFQAPALIIMRESYWPRILKSTSLKLQKAPPTGNFPRPEASHEEDKKALFRQAIIRPFQILIFSPSALLLSFYSAIGYSMLYIILVTINLIYERAYGFSQGSAGLIYLASGLGMIAGVIVCGLTSDWYLKRKSGTGEMKPEYRLPPLILGDIASVIGLVFYGWTAEYHCHWILPLIGTFFVGFGTMLSIVPVDSYLVDAFADYAASAVSGGVFFRAILGALVPLAGPALDATLGLGWGSSVLAFTVLAFVPIPIILIRYGEWLRKHKRFQVVF
ncbi:hypothetical protein MMC17_000807 [Xylographa soralifera]|nr:hypothetical protein [Xylographa soralifera]